ncbi:uncharacterized protein LOC121635080 [Melanotaenia boesemani]|uniref:uncharacterized protein LOC121635080 n=1 Tax=Melanotaenia boesemani TaxID=1250792 RepID=UPI001C03E525|nr:uncharacterized protein LOC121635080 [Melanotaenia boesemani]
MCIKNLQRELVVHKMSVKRQKVGKLPPREDLKACLTRGRQRIPELLDDLEEEYSTRDRFLLYGFLTAYWSCLYGHRPGVYANLTDAEVVEAENTGGEDGYLLYVKEHKTARAFGEAQMFLTAEEFGWLQRWMAIKATTKEDKNSFLLYTKGRGPSKNLNVYLRMAWREMGLSGEINFTLIRTAIATYAKQSSNPADRKKVAEYMCHDVRTADKYYARNPDVTEAAAFRGIFASSLEEMPSTSGGAVPLKKRKRQAEENFNIGGQLRYVDRGYKVVIYEDIGLKMISHTQWTPLSPPCGFQPTRTTFDPVLASVLDLELDLNVKVLAEYAFLQNSLARFKFVQSSPSSHQTFVTSLDIGLKLIPHTQWAPPSPPSEFQPTRTTLDPVLASVLDLELDLNVRR